jgi:hypothetical protein
MHFATAVGWCIGLNNYKNHGLFLLVQRFVCQEIKN